MSLRTTVVTSLCLGALCLGAPVSARDPVSRAPSAPSAQRSAQSRECQTCMREQCGTPASACRTTCETTLRLRPPIEFERCETACVQRFRACIATCAPCGGAYVAPPGVEPFRPDPNAPRVVTIPRPRRR
ncbi:MAG: hypothetical protein IPN17_10385 [Deltaproteobacteria bacterium]|jgi:hypothetical protein|nr:hypothetical protein [Deltaproteobacteria bacterium]MBK8692679.1 hypothetical protein [Deltaproteobacteria bacterium]MBP6831321.1 hypothetical protein [Deltaproteobacteria bacterium]